MAKLSQEEIMKAMGLLSQIKSHRFFYKVSGFTDEELNRPLIAIANTMQEAGVGHMHLKHLAEAVKAGIYTSGGTPIEFNTIGPCAGYCRDSTLDFETMHYDLPQRDVMADSVEVQMRNYGADGLVCIGTCDKSIPGLWLGAARLNLPTIFLPGGPAVSGDYRGKKVAFPTDVILGGIKKVISGEITEDEFKSDMSQMEGRWLTSCGACPELTTANTVQMATEVMGLCLPFASTLPGNDSSRIRLAKDTGYRIVELVKKGIVFRQFVTEESIKDAVRLIMATSAGTNGLLHLLSLAKFLNLNINLDTFDEICNSTPYYCPIRPIGPYTMIDLHKAGGVFAVLKRINDKISIARATVSGKTINELIQETDIKDDNVIRPLHKAISPIGGIVVMRGNLAPNGALSRYTVVDESKREFKGPAKCFNDQQSVMMAIISGDVKSGDVVVIRYQGPRGGPGFVEDFKVVLLLGLLGLDDVVVLTDSRFSGASEGALYVGYISPEAQVGGPLAILKDGDMIRISIKDKRVDVELSDKEINKRFAEWKPPQPYITPGILVDWHLLGTQFEEGAMVQRKI